MRQPHHNRVTTSRSHLGARCPTQEFPPDLARKGWQRPRHQQRYSQTATRARKRKLDPFGAMLAYRHRTGFPNHGAIGFPGGAL